MRVGCFLLLLVRVFSAFRPSYGGITNSPFVLPLPPLLCSIGDGVVRIYRNYDQSPSSGSEDPIELVTSWRVLNDRIKVKRGSGCVVHWQQDHATLLVGGDTRTVRIWDAQREMCVQVRVSSSFRYVGGKREADLRAI